MSTQFQMIEIMNAALVSEGFEQIVSANDGSDEYRLLSRNWPLVVEPELEDGLYHFARKQVFLQSRQAGAFGFGDAYLVPPAALHVRRVWTEDADGNRDQIAWAQDGQRVYVDHPDGVYIEYAEAADPSFWTPTFTRGVQMRLQAVLLRFREDRAAASEMDQQAEIYFQRARTASSKSRSATEPYKPSRFAKARFKRV